MCLAHILLVYYIYLTYFGHVISRINKMFNVSLHELLALSDAHGAFGPAW